MAGDGGLGEAGQLLHVGTQFLRAERAVQADGERLCMPHRVIERRAGLAGKRAARGVGDRAGNDHRQLQAVCLKCVFDRYQRGLCVQRVEDRLDQDEVDAAFEQAVQGFAVRRHQLVERDRAEARIVHVGRERGGLVGRAEPPCHEARFAGMLRLPGAHHVGGKACRGDVEFARQPLHAVVGERDRGRIEGVGLDDVRARLQVLRVYVANQLRLGQRKEVVVAAQLLRPCAEARAAIVFLGEPGALDHRAHRPVEQEDPLGEQRGELGGVGRNVHRIRKKKKPAQLSSETGPHRILGTRLFSGICYAPAS